jgi:predicted nucleic acid-binding Zn ribbon protein
MNEELNQNHSNESEKFSKLKIEKCPVCGKPLETGFIIAPRGIYWDTKEHKYTTLFSQPLISQWTWNVVNVPSLRCTNCGITIFRHEKVSPRAPEAYFKNCVKCGEKIPLASEYCPRCGVEQKQTGVEP